MHTGRRRRYGLPRAKLYRSAGRCALVTDATMGLSLPLLFNYDVGFHAHHKLWPTDDVPPASAVEAESTTATASSSCRPCALCDQRTYPDQYLHWMLINIWEYSISCFTGSDCLGIFRCVSFRLVTIRSDSPMHCSLHANNLYQCPYRIIY